MNYGKHPVYIAIQERLEGATQLTICDPYALTEITMRGDDMTYTARLKTLIPPTLERLHFVYDHRNETKTRLAQNQWSFPNIKISTQIFHKIHDRIWIIDGRQAFITGVSFSSNVLHTPFIIDFSEEKYPELQAYLEKHNIPPFGKLEHIFCKIHECYMKAEEAYDDMYEAKDKTSRACYKTFVAEYNNAIRYAKSAFLHDEVKRLEELLTHRSNVYLRQFNGQNDIF